MAPKKPLRESVPSLWRTIRFFSSRLRPHRLLLVGAMVALSVEIILTLAAPWPLKYVIDSLIMPVQSEGAVAMDPMTLLTVAAVAVALIATLQAIANYLHSVGFALIGSRVLIEVRGELFQHLHTLPLTFHSKAKSGDLITRVISDLGILRETMISTVLPLAGSIAVLFGMLGVMFWLNWQLALLALAIVPLFWLSVNRSGRRIQHISRRQRQKEGEVASIAAESITAIQTVQALSLDRKFARDFAARSRSDLAHGVKAKRLSAKLVGTVNILIGIATALVLWLGARLVLTNDITPGELLVFLAYLKSAFKPVRGFAKHAAKIAKASTAGERVLDIFDQSPDVFDRPDAIAAPPFRGDVAFKDVSFSYHADTPALQGITLDVQAGRHVALVGASGSGKSTLMSLLMRLYDPGEGCITVDGRDIRDYTLDSLRAQCSVVLQDPHLFAASVRDNIACGAADVTQRQIEQACRLANAHDFILSLPQGYDTVLGERGATLSRGQRQRLAIARAAVRLAPILILDEPVTGLDRENELVISQALNRLAKNKTAFHITHHLHHAIHADLIVFLDKGRIVEQGSHDQLIKLNGRYAAMYRALDVA